MKANLATTGNLRLVWGVHNAPKDAPSKVLRQIESEAQALAVSIASGNHKLAYIAACIGKSVAYVSRMKDGKRPIPDRLVGPLCGATGSNLLRQYRDLREALEGVTEAREVERLAALVREAA